MAQRTVNRVKTNAIDLTKDVDKGSIEEYNTLEFPLQDGLMTEVPVWEKHRSGNNWAAVVRKDPKAPGGLDRIFISKCKGDYGFYDVRNLKIGDALEFAADLKSNKGRRDKNRFYAVVTNLTQNKITLVNLPNTATLFEYQKTVRPDNVRYLIQEDLDALAEKYGKHEVAEVAKEMFKTK